MTPKLRHAWYNRGIAGDGGRNKLPMYVLAVLAGAAATWAAMEAEVSAAAVHIIC